MRGIAALLLLLVSALAPTGGAQTSALITGRVVAAGNGDPLRNARVTVKATPELTPLLTDADGRFAVATTASGQCTLSVTKPGYAKTSLSVQAPAGDVVVEMFRGAVVEGTVTDDSGDPVIGASVIVETVPATGRNASVLAAPLTNDLGEYRAGGLPAEQVTVSIFAAPLAIRGTMSGDGSVSISVNGRGDPQQRLYFPNVPDIARAARFSLQPGDEKTGVSFTVSATAVARSLGFPASPAAGRVAADKTSAVIRGHVLRPDGRPHTAAIVRLSPAASTLAPPKLAFTDTNGAYEFVLPSAAAGRYRVVANGLGFLGAEYGRRRASDPGAEITVAGGETRDGIVMTLQRPSAIAGRVFDEHGEPVEGLLRASQVRWVDGARRLVELAPFTRPTDDLGRYRLFGLPPGEYLVSAEVGQMPTGTPLVNLPGYATTYFPGTLTPSEAQRVVIGGDEDMLSVDFSVARIRTARVSGRAVDANGDPITGGIALMPSRRSGNPVTTQRTATIEADGRFEFPNVPPGEYVLQAFRHRSSGWNEGESFSQFITVTGVDVTDLQIRTSSGSTLSGHVVLEGGGDFTPGQIVLMAPPVDPDLSVMIGGGAARYTPDEDLEFEFAGLSGPRRVIVTRVPPGWTLRAIWLNGIDVTDTPLPFGKADQSLSGVEVVLSHHVTRVTGRVSARGRASAGSSVLFFAADRQAWYPQSRFFRRTVSGPDGMFSVEGLPPGDYLVAAADAVPGVGDSDDWQDPEYLDTLVVRARHVTLSDGEHASLTLNLLER